MKKKYTLILLLLFIMASVRAQKMTQLFESVHPAVTEVFTQNKTVLPAGDGLVKMHIEMHRKGNGFFISQSEIITAADLVYGKKMVQIRLQNGQIHNARVKRVHQSADLALLDVLTPIEDVVVAPLANSDMTEHGHPVFFASANAVATQDFTTASVKKTVGNTLNTSAKCVAYFQTTAEISTDMAGAPMFDRQGKVVGMVGHLLGESDGFISLPYVITSNAIQDMLFHTRIEWTGLIGRPLTGALATRFRLPQKEGLLVDYVDPIAPLGLMGVQKDDILLSFEGIRFELEPRALEKLERLINNLNPRDRFEIMIARDNKLLFLNGSWENAYSKL